MSFMYGIRGNKKTIDNLDIDEDTHVIYLDTNKIVSKQDIPRIASFIGDNLKQRIKKYNWVYKIYH